MLNVDEHGFAIWSLGSAGNFAAGRSHQKAAHFASVDVSSQHHVIAKVFKVALSHSRGRHVTLNPHQTPAVHPQAVWAREHVAFDVAFGISAIQ